jgi:hypothetical protein
MDLENQAERKGNTENGRPEFRPTCTYTSIKQRDSANKFSDAYLVKTLPEQVSEPDLASAYSQLPFDLFKQYVESADLPIGSTQKRFAFAKKVITIRKKAAGTSQMEEAAVLAMQGDGMAVIVTRKAKKGRNFFKVEG